MPETKEWLGHTYQEGMTLIRSVTLAGPDTALEFAQWLSNLRRLIDEDTRIKDTSVPFRRYDRGDAVWVDFGFTIGSELRGRHPAIVVNWGDTTGNATVTVVPLTSREVRQGKAEVDLGFAVSPETKSTALVHQIRTISKLRIVSRAGHIKSDNLRGVDQQILYSYMNIAGGAAPAQVAASRQGEMIDHVRPGPLKVKRPGP